MRNTIEAGNILIKDGTPLPDALRIESQLCVPGWKLVADLDGFALDREIQRTGWTFFSLAGAVKATAFGVDTQKMVRRAIKHILASERSGKFNSLEVTRVTSKRFLGVSYMSVDAQSRHIQESYFLSKRTQ